MGKSVEGWGNGVNAEKERIFDMRADPKLYT